MNEAEKQLGARIRVLRRRHFGASGKQAFATALGVSPADVERFERGAVPDGDLLVRMCEQTGEDLQWLLTGTPSRGTVVISGARGRHQDLLARVATILDQQPSFAAPIEAFIDLLTSGRAPPRPELPNPPGGRRLVPIFSVDELPERLALPQGAIEPAWLVAPEAIPGRIVHTARAAICEPQSDGQSGDLLSASVHDVRERDGVRRMIECEQAALLEEMIGVCVESDALRPMFEPGDVALVSLSEAPEIGAPVLARLGGSGAACWRIWLGREADRVNLGRMSDGESESVPATTLVWAAPILYRVRIAA